MDIWKWTPNIWNHLWKVPSWYHDVMTAWRQFFVVVGGIFGGKVIKYYNKEKYKYVKNEQTSVWI